MNAYDNATNANKTRGGVKQCLDMYATAPRAEKNMKEVSLTLIQFDYIP